MNASSKPFGIFAVEALKINKNKRKVNDKRFNRLLGSWSYGQPLLRYKAEDAGNLILEVHPKHTSQRCSRCRHIDRRNRRSLQFKCLRCGFELHADLNAARNIAQIGISMLDRLFFVNQPNVTHNGTVVTGYLSLTGSS